ncbi:hypothetical protein [Thiomonas sp. FB-6]|uniref:hypothetical protein n=1 Tax=Thiomonas sp. FB-6 TaxID=1158291 RepID=UPI0003A27F34|nr:hypothetical protein [Thiomonas sp. FB-6]
MRPWERRLGDLAHLVTSCHATYFDPDLFRMNINQFLQTARTVTFLIQKRKAEIVGFNEWYAESVRRPWADDILMRWAIESRNTIEKEGDLELHSTLSLSLVFSYFEEEDLQVDVGCDLLLHANLKRLIRFAQKNLPSGISDAAVVKIERRWIAASLPEWELLRAVNYIYAKLFECCDSLAHHLGSTIDLSIRKPEPLELQREQARQVEYIKLNGLEHFHLGQERLKRDENFVPPGELLQHIEASQQSLGGQRDFLSAFSMLVDMAAATFNHYGNHIPILHVFDHNWRPILILSTNFDDQADKYIFWRHVGDRIRNLRAAGVIWIGESWVRRLEAGHRTPTRNLPIIGEHLQIVGASGEGLEKRMAFRIIREGDAQPRLELDESESENGRVAEMNFLRPVMTALRAPLLHRDEGS